MYMRQNLMLDKDHYLSLSIEGLLVQDRLVHPKIQVGVTNLSSVYQIHLMIGPFYAGVQAVTVAITGVPAIDLAYT